MQMMSLGCESAKLKHVVRHCRQVDMILKDPSRAINLSFSFKTEGFNDMVFATAETMKCFGRGAEGHQIGSCPERSGAKQAAKMFLRYEPEIFRIKKIATKARAALLENKD